MAKSNEYDSNEVLKFKLVQNEDEIITKTEFKPAMSYQIFGQNEKLYSSDNLIIDIFYTAGSLRTYLGSTSIENFHDPHIKNIVEKLETWLKIDYFNDLDAFKCAINNDKSFLPFGKEIASFIKSVDSRDTEFVIHYNDFSNEEFQEYHYRFQSMIVFFIDAASKIPMDDLKWKCFTLYKKENINGQLIYSSVGFCTVYEFSLISKIRPRISQFFIIPEYQRRKLGSELLQSVYSYYRNIAGVCDITVEDPSPTFQIMRSIVDVNLVNNSKLLTRDIVKNGYTKQVQDILRKQFLFSSSQARCIYDIIRLAYVYIYDKNDYDMWRENLLQRLNSDYGISCEPDKKKQKLFVEINKSVNKEIEDSVTYCLQKLESDYFFVAQSVFNINK